MDAIGYALAAERLSEEPHAGEDAAFAQALTSELNRLNGEFTARAGQRGVDHGIADRWLEDVAELSAILPVATIEQAADLAVRLASLAFIMSAAPTPEEIENPLELLADARVE